MDVPTPVVNRVRGTLIEDLFFRYKASRRETKDITIKVDSEEVGFTIPVGTNFERTIRDVGMYEPLLVSELCSALGRETVYYDIGSRWGFFTTLAAMTIPGSQIHGFEANPSWFSILSGNHEQDSVHLTNSFVAEEYGQKATTVDKYCSSHGRPSVVKIDVEGAEGAVLRGMKDTIRSYHPQIYVEMHPQYLHEQEDSSNSIFSILESHGYEIDVAREHRSTDATWVALNTCEALPNTGDYLIRAT